MLKTKHLISRAAFPGYTPAQVLKAYGWNGQTIPVANIPLGFPSLGGYDPTNDIQMMLQRWGLPAAEINVSGTPGQPDPQGADIENALDGEWLAGIWSTLTGFPCRLHIDFQPNNGPGIGQSFTNLCNAGVLNASCSWGAAEGVFGNTFITSTQSALAACVAKGMHCFAATGDTSIDDNTQSTQDDFPASSPYIIAVGGVTLQQLSNGTWSIKAWGDGRPGDAGGGGGLSHVFATPAWQKSLNLSMRGTPDCASAADPAFGAQVYVNGSLLTIGGTSWASPTVCAIMAACRGYAVGKGVSVPNDPHAFLYQWANKIFTDVTVGSNGDPATVGYDFTTGWGTPIIPAMLSAFAGLPPAPNPPTPTPTPAPNPPPTPGKISLFEMKFGSNVPAGALLRIRTPVAIPAGTYDVVPAPAQTDSLDVATS